MLLSLWVCGREASECGVFDTGIGIKSELQDQIFDRFFRVNPSYKGIYKGNGLGLYIAQKYIQLLGADRVYVESEEGKGCRFYFVLSFKIGQEKDAIQTLPELDEPLERIKRKKQIAAETSKPSSLQDFTFQYLLS